MGFWSLLLLSCVRMASLSASAGLAISMASHGRPWVAGVFAAQALWTACWIVIDEVKRELRA